jgi:formate/nitrite transporter FocA (FNT family)
MPDHVQESDHLDGAEKDQAERHAPLRPLIIHEIVRAEGEAELRRPVPALFWSGLAAGLSMGFSFVAQALLQADLPVGPGRDAVASGGYMVGFAVVVLGRQQLFTESTLTAVLPALHDRTVRKWMATLRLWAIVLLANIAGTWVFSAMLAFGHPLPPATSEALAQLASEQVTHPFWNTLLRAVLAGWLIALMVWLLPAAASARFFIIVAVTWLIGVAHFSHVIAGSVETAFAAMQGGIGWTDYLVGVLIPAFIGNSIGGVVFVALLNHAQVKEEI